MYMTIVRNWGGTYKLYETETFPEAVERAMRHYEEEWESCVIYRATEDGDPVRLAQFYPDKKKESTMINPVIVSRHPAAIEFIREEAGLPEDTPVIEQATAADVEGKDVYGNIPLHLAALAATVHVVEFKDPPRGAEYTVDDMRAAGATLRAYTVVRNYE